MSNLSSKELDLYSNQILEDYDAKKPSQIFKNKVKVGNEDALLIQNKVTEVPKVICSIKARLTIEAKQIDEPTKMIHFRVPKIRSIGP